MILAGDVGGTNCRLALYEVEDGRLRQRAEGRVPSRDANGNINLGTAGDVTVVP